MGGLAILALGLSMTGWIPYDAVQTASPPTLTTTESPTPSSELAPTVEDREQTAESTESIEPMEPMEPMDPWASVPVQSVVTPPTSGATTPTPTTTEPRPTEPDLAHAASLDAPLLDPWAPRAARHLPTRAAGDLRDPFDRMARTTIASNAVTELRDPFADRDMRLPAPHMRGPAKPRPLTELRNPFQSPVPPASRLPCESPPTSSNTSTRSCSPAQEANEPTGERVGETPTESPDLLPPT